ncbi:MAG: methyltransferase domain-containing protein [Bacteroidota bacterium]
MAIERIVPGTKEWEAFYANHILRYQFASQILNGSTTKSLLDAACGVGYGSEYLSKQPGIEKVVAIDRSAEALKIAAAHFNSAKINFLQDDCHTLEAAEKYGLYDAVVSFETLEHLPRPADFLSSCFANIKSNGKIIISTPNKSVSSPEELNWEYHEKEYSATEFFEVLSQAGFKNIQLYGQQYNLKGKIKNEVRGDLNKLFSNPFVRAGRWLQGRLKGHTNTPILKETIDDFEIVRYNEPADCERLGINGPFVLIAVAEK